jgi:hypothetical protein
MPGMDAPVKPEDGFPPCSLPVWATGLGLAILLAWQGWLTAALFGDNPWQNLTNDQPIVSGSHPPNLYYGSQGAKAIVAEGRTTTYDHNFNGGYPKTPIFDGGRLAELLLVLGGGAYRPEAYKIGFAVMCLLVPLFIFMTAKSIGLEHGTALVATFLGQLVWWGPHGRLAMTTGDCQLYLASLAGLSHVGMLIAFHRSSSVTAWFGLLLTGALGWFLQPLLFPIALPILLIYYLSVGAKHEFLTWHVAFWWVEILAVIVNLPWLMDWVDSWWLRAALPSASGLLEHRTLPAVWNAPLWGGEANRVLAIVLVASAALGVIILNQARERASARLFGVAIVGALVLALLGISWEPLGMVGTAALFAPALWFAAIPAAHAWVWSIEWLWRRGKIGRSALGVIVAGAAGCLICWNEIPLAIIEQGQPGDALEIGLDADREAIVKTLIDETTPDARILFEDRDRDRRHSRWSALLPLLTERAYVGGLDPDGFIEHSSITLRQQMLEGRPIASLTDADLMNYCTRYNIRWIVAWSPAVIERLEQWPEAKRVKALCDGDSGWLFTINRKADFAIKGMANLLPRDGPHITLANVVPDDGEVIISLHYQAGMRAYPARVKVERADSTDDRIGFIRLKLNNPASRVTLVWERK